MTAKAPISSGPLCQTLASIDQHQMPGTIRDVLVVVDQQAGKA
jgi:hypothetical protein